MRLPIPSSKKVPPSMVSSAVWKLQPKTFTSCRTTTLDSFLIIMKHINNFRNRKCNFPQHHHRHHDRQRWRCGALFRSRFSTHCRYKAIFCQILYYSQKYFVQVFWSFCFGEFSRSFFCYKKMKIAALVAAVGVAEAQYSSGVVTEQGIYNKIYENFIK